MMNLHSSNRDAATWPHIAEDKMKIDYSHMIFQERDRQAGDTV
jgi:hypothetical protein